MANTTRLLVLYHSSYGHVETLAYAVAHGARAVDGVQVSIKRVPELMPEEIMRGAGMKVDQPAAIADPQELANYDAIIFGTPTRFGNMSSQMRNFLDQRPAIAVSLMRRVDDYGAEEVRAATRIAVERGAPTSGSIAHVLEQRRRAQGLTPPVPIDLSHRPELRDLRLIPHRLEDYDALGQHDPGDDDPDA